MILAVVVAAMLAVVPASAWAANGGDLAAGSGSLGVSTQAVPSGAYAPDGAFATQTTDMGVEPTFNNVLADGKYIIACGTDAQSLVGMVSKGNGAAADISHQNGTNYQVWKFSYVTAKKAYIITNVATKKNLTLSGNLVVQKKAAKKGKAYKKQLWRIQATSRGLGIVSYYNKSLVLTISGMGPGGLTAQPGVGAASQYFWVFSSKGWNPGMAVKNGTYTIKSSAADSYLQVRGASLSEYQPFEVASKVNANLNQMFEIQASNGFYSIQNVMTGRAVTVNGYDIVQRKFSGQATQLWAAYLNGDGTVTFQNAATGAVLDLSGSTATAGASKGSATQKWVLSPTTTGLSSVHQKGLAKVSTKSSNTNMSIALDLTNHELMLFERSAPGSAWALKDHWRISNGIHKATIPGTSKKTQFRYTNDPSKGYSCYYWSRMGSKQYMHSILYNPGTMSVQDGRLGKSISNGCVRMSLSHAKQIYYEVPEYTRVQKYYK